MILSENMFWAFPLVFHCLSNAVRWCCMHIYLFSVQGSPGRPFWRKVTCFTPRCLLVTWLSTSCGLSKNVLSLNNTIYILRDTKLVQCDEFDPSTDRVGCNRLYDVSDQVKHEWTSVYRKLGGYAVWNQVSSRKIESTVRTTTITDILFCDEKWMNTKETIVWLPNESRSSHGVVSFGNVLLF